MTSWQVISRSEHAQARWRQRKGYEFAADQQVVEVLLAELGNVLPHYALGFIKAKEQYQLIAVLGLGNERNYFVGLDNKWMCSVIPAAFRGYPFILLPNSESAERVLCIDEGYLSEDSNDTAVFQEDGELDPSTAKVLDFLNKCDSNRDLTQKACDSLAEANIIEPWPLKISAGDDEEAVPIEWLYRINEPALNKLSRSALAVLRSTSALPLAYAQLFSVHQLKLLSERAKLLDLQLAQVDSNQGISGIFEDEGSLNFDAI
jgi:hypothetical protein